MGKMAFHFKTFIGLLNGPPEGYAILDFPSWALTEADSLLQASPWQPACHFQHLLRWAWRWASCPPCFSLPLHAALPPFSLNTASYVIGRHYWLSFIVASIYWETEAGYDHIPSPALGMSFLSTSTNLVCGKISPYCSIMQA